MVSRDVCPRCQFPEYKNNGHIHHGKQHYHGHDGGRQVVDCFAQDLVSGGTRALIERWRGERISLPGICRAVGVGLRGLSGVLVHGVEALPDHLQVQPATCQGNVTRRRLEVEADAMHSVVQQKATKPWFGSRWMPRRVRSWRFMGDRRCKRAKPLWAKIPLVSRPHAAWYTDHEVVWAGVIPATQHRAITTLARQMPHLEPFNPTRRQHVSRLGRETLSSSKKLANPVGAIKRSICHDHLTRTAA